MCVRACALRACLRGGACAALCACARVGERARMRARMRQCVRVGSCVRVRTFVRACVRACFRACACARKHACGCVRVLCVCFAFALRVVCECVHSQRTELIFPFMSLRLARAISARDSCAFAASTWASLVGEMHTQQANCGERDLLLKLLIGRAGSGPRPFPGGGRHSLGGANSAAGPGNSQRQGDRRCGRTFVSGQALSGSALVL